MDCRRDLITSRDLKGAYMEITASDGEDGGPDLSSSKYHQVNSIVAPSTRSLEIELKDRAILDGGRSKLIDP